MPKKKKNDKKNNRKIMIQCPYILQYNFKKKGYLTFEPLTLMPIQLKMVDPSLLNQKEVCMVDFHFV